MKVTVSAVDDVLRMEYFIMKKIDNFLNRQDSFFLKGIGILFMVFHHFLHFQAGIRKDCLLICIMF